MVYSYTLMRTEVQCDGGIFGLCKITLTHV
jgi:hypothetical protein